MPKKLVLVFLLILLCGTLTIPAVAQDPAFTVKPLVIENQPAYDMKISSDGRIAAVYNGSNTLVSLGMDIAEYDLEENLLPIRLIDLTTGEELGQLTGHTDYVGDVAFTPDGTRLAAYLRNGDIYLWNMETLHLEKRLTAIIAGLQMTFLPDNRTLVVLMRSITSYFLLWDIETGYMTQVWRNPYSSFGDIKYSDVKQQFDYIYIAFAISPDGHWLATATVNGELVLWDTTTLEQTTVQPREDDHGTLNIQGITFSADSQTLVYHNTDTAETIFWDIVSQSQTTVLDFGSRFYSFALSPDQKVLVWIDHEGIWLAQLDQPDQPIKILEFPLGLTAYDTPPVFTPDGQQFIVGGFKNDQGGGSNVIYVITLE